MGRAHWLPFFARTVPFSYWHRHAQCPLIRVQQVMRSFGKAVIYVNAPVDVKDSGARDYFDIIKPDQARDLGSIKSQLKSMSHFATPKAFADVSAPASLDWLCKAECVSGHRVYQIAEGE